MTATTPPTVQKDNLFGVCNALGEEFGFNPLWLRIALAASFIFAPVPIILGYFAIGAVVLAARLIFPRARPSADIIPLEAPAAETPVEYARAA